MYSTHSSACRCMERIHKYLPKILKNNVSFGFFCILLQPINCLNLKRRCALANIWYCQVKMDGQFHQAVLSPFGHLWPPSLPCGNCTNKVNFHSTVKTNGFHFRKEHGYSMEMTLVHAIMFGHFYFNHPVPSFPHINTPWWHAHFMPFPPASTQCIWIDYIAPNIESRHTSDKAVLVWDGWT